MTPASEHGDAGFPVTTGAASAAMLPEPKRRLRTMTSTEEIDHTITRPGSVKINVKGAFIVDPDTATPALAGGSVANGRHSPTHHETSDIRLPNHTAVVSHIAVDVCDIPSSTLECGFFFVAMWKQLTNTLARRLAARLRNWCTSPARSGRRRNSAAD